MTNTLPRLFIKTGCPWCTEAIEVLEQKKIQYAVLDVRKDPKLFDEMVKLSGQSKAPTLDWNGEILADFGADELIPFLKKKGL